MKWEDMTDKFQEDLESAMTRKIFQGDSQPIVEIIQDIQKESFLDGMQYVVQVLQDIITKEVMDHE